MFKVYFIKELLFFISIFCVIPIKGYAKKNDSYDVFFIVRHHFDNLEYQKASLELERLVQSESLKENDSLKAEWYLLSCNLSMSQKNFTQCYDEINSGISFCENKKLYNQLTNFYIRLSILFTHIGHSKESKDYIHLATQMAQKLNDSVLIYKTMLTETALFYNQDQNDNYIRGYIFFSKFKNLYIDNIITCKFNIALNLIDSNPTIAMQYFRHIINVSALNDKKVPLCNAYSCLAELYFNAKKYDTASFFFKKSIAIGNQINDVEVLSKNYHFLSKINTIKKNIQKAYSNLLLFKKYSDTLYERQLRGKEMLAKHREIIAQKNEHINSLSQNLKNHISKSNLYLTILILSVLFFLSIILITFLLYKQKIKVNKLKIIEANARNERLENIQTEMKNLQKQNEYKAKIDVYLSAQKNIARELHDQVANTLAACKMKISMMLQTNEQNTELHSLSNIIENIYNKIRNLSHSLYTPDIEYQHLPELLEDFVFEFQTNSNIKMHWSLHPQDEFERLSNSLKSNIYLIVRELFINTHKHASASEVNLNINIHEHELILLYSDNGQGFDISTCPKNGLKNIDWRIKKFNGEYTVDSSPSTGIIITIIIPLI